MVEIAKIKLWLDASGMKPSKLGLLACANQYAVDRIMSGKASVATLHSVMSYIERNPVKRGKR